MQRSTGTNTNTSAASQACAVCRYQRKKCTPNCPLAPFFPASNHKDFLNTRKLFGVRNITKLVENLNPQQKVIAIKSMIFEANIRAKDPVGGCYRIICELQRQIDWNRAELELVLYQLSICKSTKEQQSEYQVVKVVDDDQGLEDFNVYDTMPLRDHVEESKNFQGNYGGSSSTYKVFDSNFVKHALSDVGEDIKPLLATFGDKSLTEFPFESEGLNVQIRFVLLLLLLFVISIFRTLLI